MKRRLSILSARLKVWTDLDVIFGDLRAALTDERLRTCVSVPLPRSVEVGASRQLDAWRSAMQSMQPQRHDCSYDVITMPDGLLDALYTAGQLCVFRNIGYFRTVFQISTRHKERSSSLP